MIELIVSARGVPEEKAFTFEQNIIKIGRVKENDIAQPGANISRLHCLITYENGEFYISDQSSNGTLLNGENIGKNRKMPLRHGDQIQAGDFIIQFKVKTPEEELEKTTDYLQMKFAQLLSEPKADAAHPSLLVMGGPTNGTAGAGEQLEESCWGGHRIAADARCPAARIIRRGTLMRSRISRAQRHPAQQPAWRALPLRDRDKSSLARRAGSHRWSSPSEGRGGDAPGGHPRGPPGRPPGPAHGKHRPLSGHPRGPVAHPGGSPGGGRPRSIPLLRPRRNPSRRPIRRRTENPPRRSRLIRNRPARRLRPP
jgi:pSer/pThr/pTyr-binding forkhead associated (FHA) protein